MARFLGIKRNTAYRFSRRIDGRDGVLTLPRGDVRRRLVTDEALRDTGVAIVEEHPDFILEPINAELWVHLPSVLRISRSTLANVLAGNIIVMKKFEDAETEPEPRDSDSSLPSGSGWWTPELIWSSSTLTKLDFILGLKEPVDVPGMVKEK